MKASLTYLRGLEIAELKEEDMLMVLYLLYIDDLKYNPNSPTQYISTLHK
tara:strand:- start:160 stop:309 length:150 start_codon:yes stop_codon:yes gene_type:complete